VGGRRRIDGALAARRTAGVTNQPKKWTQHMTTKIELAPAPANPVRTLAKKVAALLYGFACYGFFLVTFLYTVGFVANVAVPKTIDNGPAVPLPEAMIVNTLLLALFAIQHSAMARPAFKQRWTRYVPQPVERSTYVLLSTVCLAVLLWQWRSIPVLIWHIEDQVVATGLLGVSLVGWSIVLVSTFLINHFELLGLHQVTNNLTGKQMPAPRFYTPLLYKFVRHPLYLGFIIAFWATPAMTAGHLLFAAGMTVYIFIGIALEERDLITVFGDEYRRYRHQVSMIVPWRKSS
jgi:methanethiol S-methyltransferase